MGEEEHRAAPGAGACAAAVWAGAVRPGVNVRSQDRLPESYWLFRIFSSRSSATTSRMRFFLNFLRI